MNPDAVPAPGTLLAHKYRVVRVLGQGGMGVVLQATHEVLATAVAIKVMSAEALEQENAIPRFLREARAAAALKSEYVARVTDFGTLDDGRPFMVMELLEGRDLSAIMKSDGLPRDEWIDAYLQACAGLAEAHVGGIVHRDLKLANFFRTRRPDGSHCTKILDFGISKLAKTDGLLDTTTKSSVLLGTPYYMSPEHVRSSRDVDSRSDIWQMGVVLYQAMTGYLPFDGDNVGTLFARILEVEPRPPSGLAPDLPEPIERAILACLDKDPERRPRTIAQVAAWIEPFAGPEGKLAAQRARAMQGDAALPSMPAMPSSPSLAAAAPLDASSPQRAAISSPGKMEWTEAPVSAPAGASVSPPSRRAVLVGGLVVGSLALAALGTLAFTRIGLGPGTPAVSSPAQGAPSDEAHRPTEPPAANPGPSSSAATPASASATPSVAVSASAPTPSTPPPGRTTAPRPRAPTTTPRPPVPERPTLN